jgi:hypothetical protein
MTESVGNSPRTATVPQGQSNPNSPANKFLQAAMGYYKAAPPYVFGGGHGGPQQGYGSVDCSGLVIQSLYKAGVANPENLVSTANTPGKPVSRNDLQPGDLCYKTGSGEGGHVAIYIGDGKILEAYSTGKPPRIRELGNPDEFDSFRRVFDQGGDPVSTNGLSVSPPSNGGGAPASSGSAASYGGDNASVSGGGSRSGLSLPSSGGGGAGAPNAASAASSGPPPGDMPSGDVEKWIEEAIQILLSMGIPADKIDKKAIAMIIQHESGGNPHAINLTDSNAAAGHPSKGLMQTIDGTFNEWAAPGHNDVWNPVDNIVAGVRYAINRYGSLDNVPGVKAVNNGGSYVGY